MHLNHPQNIPPTWSMEKLLSLVPKKVGDHCSRQCQKAVGKAHPLPSLIKLLFHWMIARL